MVKEVIVTGTLIDEECVSYVEVCQQLNIPEASLIDLLEHGLLGELKKSYNELIFDHAALKRIRTADRLQQDLGINIQGVVLAIELLDELNRLKNELGILQRQLEDPNKEH